MTEGNQPHIVLVHGAWHGAWAWARFTPLLAKEGFSFSTLDLSGLGANEHRQAPEIGLHVHGQDILNHLFFNDLHDTVVVGHSYGAVALSQAVAGDTEQRIAHAIYLDTIFLGDGESVASLYPEKKRAEYEAAAAGEKMITPPAPANWENIWGLTAEIAAWCAPRMRPLSARCFTESVQGDPFASSIRRTSMRCVHNKNRLLDKVSEEAKNEKGFVLAEVEGHHDVMVTDPQQMLDALLSAL